jgi:DNA-binding NarL/FixJ family response regulator
MTREERRHPYMNVVCYAPSMDILVHDSWELFQFTDPQFGLELHRSLESLAARLRYPLGGIGAVIVYITDNKDIEEIKKIDGLLSDLPVIVIIKCSEDEVIENVRSLNPRVILYSYFDVANMGSVVESVMKRSKDRLGRQRVNQINALSEGG